MIAASIATHINKTLVGDVRNKPRNFIGMGFYHYLKLCAGVNDAIHRSIAVYFIFINRWLNIIQPQLLSLSLKSGWRRIINVCFEKFPVFIRKQGGFLYSLNGFLFGGHFLTIF